MSESVIAIGLTMFFQLFSIALIDFTPKINSIL